MRIAIVDDLETCLLYTSMASCIRPRWDREMRRPDKSEKDAPTVITPKPPIWISTINTA